MDLEIIPNLIAGLVTALLAAGTRGFIENLLTNKKSTTTPTPAEKLSDALRRLRSTAGEMDSVIAEVSSDIQRRQEAFTELQIRSEELTNRESELKKKIEHLEKIPIEVAAYFQEINEANLRAVDKRNGRRDLTFFILGIVASVTTTIVLKYLGF